MKVELTSIKGNIVINYIKGKKSRTYMFPTEYVNLEDVNKKVAEWLT